MVGDHEMSLSLDQLYQHAISLPDESRVALAERLVEYIVTHIDPKLQQEHLSTAKKRRDDIRSGKVRPLDGEETLQRIRGRINK